MTVVPLRQLLPARSAAQGDALIEQIDALLPQTQCGKCGTPGCKPYAAAIVAGEADINQCPPGGEEGIRELAALLGREFKPLNPANGVEKPPEIAVIDENICIGCTLCIQACPVDAISGAAKLMHTVVVSLCTGCELCVAPCPVDCISMIPAHNPPTTREQRLQAANEARERYEFRNARLMREKQEKAERLAAKLTHKLAEKAQADAEAVASGTPLPGNDLKKALIAAALARAKAQREAVQPRNTAELSPQQQAQIDAAEERRRALHTPEPNDKESP